MIAAPLNALLRKGVDFIWTPECQLAFETLTNILINSPILAFPNFGARFVLYCDASKYGISGVLSQIIDGKERVIAYSSRATNPHEQNYTVTELECLSAYYHVKQFRPYLAYREFDLVVDHSALQWLRKMCDSNPRLVRWSLKLEEYNYKVIHKPGATHKNADALSREPFIPQDPENIPIIAAITAVTADEEIQDEIARFQMPQATLPETQVTDSLLDLICSEQAMDEHCKMIMAYLTKPESVARSMTPGLMETAKDCFIHEGLLMRGFNNNRVANGRVTNQVILPLSMRSTILQIFHDSPITGGHLGSDKVRGKIQTRFWWNRMYSDISNYVASCLICQQSKGNPKDNAGKLGTIDAQYPFDIVGIDFIGPLPRTLRGHEYLVVVIDYYTKWVEAYPVVKANAEEIAMAFVYGFISRHGCPARLLSDRGLVFVGKVMMEICKLLNIKKITTTPYHPQTDGITERVNQVIEHMVRALGSKEQNDWDLIVQLVLFAYRTSVHSSTKETPFYLTSDRDPIFPIDVALGVSRYEAKDIESFAAKLRDRLKEAYGIVTNNIGDAHLRNQIQYDKKHKYVSYNVGDLAWLYVIPKSGKGLTKKLKFPWQGPVQIVQRMSATNYLIRRPTKAKVMKQIVHVQRLKPYIPRSIPEGTPELDMFDDFVPKLENDLDLATEEELVEIEAAEEFVPIDIISSRHTEEGVEYFVQWDDQGLDKSWVSAEQMAKHKTLLKRYQSGSREKRVKPKQATPSVEVPKDSAAIPVDSTSPISADETVFNVSGKKTRDHKTDPLYVELLNVYKLTSNKALTLRKLKENLVLLLGMCSAYVTQSLGFQNELAIRNCKTIDQLTEFIKHMIDDYNSIYVSALMGLTH